jgi:hypothetical protein
MLAFLLDALFGCRHGRKSFPLTPKAGAGPTSETYVTCLDCGKAFMYDWATMRIGEAVKSRQMLPGEFQIDQCATRNVVVRQA